MLAPLHPPSGHFHKQSITHPKTNADLQGLEIVAAPAAVPAGACLDWPILCVGRKLAEAGGGARASVGGPQASAARTSVGTLHGHTSEQGGDGSRASAGGYLGPFCVPCRGRSGGGSRASLSQGSRYLGLCDRDPEPFISLQVGAC